MTRFSIASLVLHFTMIQSNNMTGTSSYERVKWGNGWVWWWICHDLNLGLYREMQAHTQSNWKTNVGWGWSRGGREGRWRDEEEDEWGVNVPRDDGVSELSEWMAGWGRGVSKMKYIFKKRKKMDQNTALKIRRLKKQRGQTTEKQKKKQQRKGEKIKAQGTKGRSQQKAARNTKRGGSIYIYMHIYM